MASLRQVEERLRALPGRRVTVASVVLVLLAYFFVGWSGMTRLGDSRAYDSGAFKEYADTIRETGRLPLPAENYEYSLPPGYPLIGAYLDRAVSALRSPPAARSNRCRARCAGRCGWRSRCSRSSCSLSAGHGRGFEPVA